jgi:Fe-S cluster assembly protein SufD
MTEYALGIDSPYTYIWHDGCGQVVPTTSDLLKATVNGSGFEIKIADNVKLIEPIVIINTAANANHSNNSIFIGKKSQVQIIEYLISDQQNSTNHVQTKIECDTSARLQHCILDHASPYENILQHNQTQIIQNHDSHVESSVFSFGGGRSRIELQLLLQGEGAHCSIGSLAYTNKAEVQEVYLKIEHKTKHCTSNTITRNVLKDNSSTDLSGKIIVHPGASKTVAELQIKNLICSAKAQATNKPELEIFNDDVRCTHGSSTGQLDEAALFYIRSRGIDLASATAMLIDGFIYPVIASCHIEKVAAYVTNVIKDR